MTFMVTTVEDLLNQTRTGWEDNLLENLFNRQEVDQIRTIPIAEVNSADKIIWVEDESGEYTVKSCYKKLMIHMHVDNTIFWAKFWKLKLPPKIKSFLWQVCSGSLPTQDRLRAKRVPVPELCQICNGEGESADHLFVRCQLARGCWDSIGNNTHQSCSNFMEWLESNFINLDDNALCRLIAICWKIWEARNDKIWNQVVIPINAVVSSATIYLHEWQAINQGHMQQDRRSDREATWQKPPEGWKKLNVDAALDVNNKKMGFGFVLRNEEGQFVAARQVPWNGVYKPDEAEALGVREALKWLKEITTDPVQIETDCSKIISTIHTQKMQTSFDLILNDVRELANVFTNICFLFAKRSTNKVAHLLAREALSKSDCADTFVVPFVSVVHALELDST